MPIDFRFNKATGERYMDCIAGREPITDVETVDDALTLAGTCIFFAANQLSELDVLRGEKSVPKEHREALIQARFQDLWGVLEFVGQLQTEIRDGIYEDHLEDDLEVRVTHQDGKKRVEYISGRKPKE